MGAGHVYEAEYHFDEGVSMDEVREQIITLLESTKLYEYVDPDTASKIMFRRQGEVNDLKYAYPSPNQNYVYDKQKTVYGIHTTQGLGFKDDMAFTFSTKPDGKLVVKTLSLSRIGESDWGQNAKNIGGIMEQLKQKKTITVLRDTNKAALVQQQ